MTLSLYDVVIVGGGTVGLTLAMLLKKMNLQVALVEESPKRMLNEIPEKYDIRVSAINLACKRVLEYLDVWQVLEQKRLSHFLKMHVWDAGSSGFIEFDCYELGQTSLGYIIENKILQSTLLSCLDKQEVDLFFSEKPTRLIEVNNVAQLELESGKILSASLIVGADGAHSWIRDNADIKVNQWSYQQSALVTTVETILSHCKTAWQVFLPTGPLAFLPLQDKYHCSVVWSTTPQAAEQLHQGSDDDFNRLITNAFSSKLGDVTKVDQSKIFPLYMRHAKHYVKPRVALVGDAAHTIHLLAGQGVNLGILDAASLAQIVIDAKQRGRDIGSFNVLRRYERWRKSENWIMIAGMEFFNRLFSHEIAPVAALRGMGLNMTNNVGFIKNKFAAYAMGLEGDLPEIAC